MKWIKTLNAITFYDDTNNNLLRLNPFAIERWLEELTHDIKSTKNISSIYFEFKNDRLILHVSIDETSKPLQYSTYPEKVGRFQKYFIESVFQGYGNIIKK